MKSAPTIEAVAWRSHEGGLGEPGALTRTTIRFIDQDGKIAEVARRLSQTREKSRAATEQALEAKPARRRYLFWLRSLYERSEQYLLNKGRRLIRKTLRGEAETIGLKVDAGGAQPFRAIDSPSKVDEIREDIESADRWDFWIAKVA